MRNLFTRKKLNLSQQAIQPIFICPHNKTGKVLSPAFLDMPNKTIRQQASKNNQSKIYPFKSKTISQAENEGLLKDDGKFKQELTIRHIVKHINNGHTQTLVMNDHIHLRKKTEKKSTNDFSSLAWHDKFRQLSNASEDINDSPVNSNRQLLKNIQLLRLSEKKYITSVEEYQPQSQKNYNHLQLQTLKTVGFTQPLKDEEQYENAVKKISKFKQKLKVRQSKKNIYRILKNKNDHMHKIKRKNGQIQKYLSNIQAKDTKQLQLLRLHCPQIKSYSCNTHPNNFKSLGKTYHSNRPAENKNKSVEKKPALELRSTKCQFGPCKQYQQNRFSKKKGIQIYQQIVSRMKEEDNNMQVFLKVKQDKMPPIKNIFRELTPWRDQ